MGKRVEERMDASTVQLNYSYVIAMLQLKEDGLEGEGREWLEERMREGCMEGVM